MRRAFLICREPDIRSERFAVAAMTPALHRRPELRGLFPTERVVKFRQERRYRGAHQTSLPRQHQLFRRLVRQFDESAFIHGDDRGRAGIDQRSQLRLRLQRQCGDLRNSSDIKSPHPASASVSNAKPHKRWFSEAR